MMNYEIVRFGVVGVVATAIHYGVYYVLLNAGADRNVAFVAGYLVSFVCNYLLSSFFTFGVGLSWKRLAGFTGSHVVNFFVQVVLFNVFCWVGVPAGWAPLPVYGVAVPVNFLLVRFALKRPTPKASSQPPPEGGGDQRAA